MTLAGYLWKQIYQTDLLSNCYHEESSGTPKRASLDLILHKKLIQQGCCKQIADAVVASRPVGKFRIPELLGSG